MKEDLEIISLEYELESLYNSQLDASINEEVKKMFTDQRTNNEDQLKNMLNGGSQEDICSYKRVIVMNFFSLVGYPQK